MGRAQRNRRGRGRCGRPVTKIYKWEDQEVLELSRLVLAFVRRSGGILPKKSDVSFWTVCCEHFQRRFTERQLNDKVRNIKLRFLRLSSGQAKSVKVSERETFHLWAQITHLYEQGINDMMGPLKGKAPMGGGDDKGGAHAAGGPRAREEEEQDTCTCTIENVSTESQHGHGEDNGTNAKRANYDAHGTLYDGETAHNITLCQHMIVADIAATTKTLAEYVHSQGKHAMA